MAIKIEDMAKCEDISTLTGYLTHYGAVLARKAIHSLRPLHVPGKDPIPSFDDYNEDRTPMEAQQHVAAAAVQAFDKHGSVFINGEPGVGKTITSIAAIHEHARRSRRKGGYGGKYRAIVVCPDTLVMKWVREIETTIPDAHVITVGKKKDKWSDVLKIVESGKSHTKKRLAKKIKSGVVSTVEDADGFMMAARADDRDAARAFVSSEVVTEERDSSIVQHPKHWERDCPVVWLVLGRDKIKSGAAATGMGVKRRGFDGKLREHQPCKLVEVDRVNVLDKDGCRTYKPGDRYGSPITKGVYEKRLACPKCGKIPMDKNKPLTPAQLGTKMQTCEGIVLQEVTKEGYGNDVLFEQMNYKKYGGMGDDTFPSHARRCKPGTRISHAGKSWEVQQCGEELYQYARKPNKWPAATLIQRKLRKWAKYLVIDECHQHKGEGTAQAIAMGKVLSTAKHSIAMTGTLIGGYADHLFPLMIRLAGKEMKERGFQWGSRMPFVEKYGCIDRIVTGTVPVSTSTKLGSSRSLAKKIGSVSEESKPRPGIMPTLFAHLVMKRSIFLKLDQFIDHLPGFEAKMRPVEMDSDIQFEYNRFAAELEGECSKLLASGNMKLLGTMLWTLLSYPDCPFDWTPKFDGDEAVGWWKLPKVYTPDNFVGVTTPRNFDRDRILPKEQAVIEKCKEYASKGEQSWIYTLLSKVHSPVSHLQEALQKEGLRVGVLTSGDASPAEREAYINKVGRNVDVMISHPGLVATGLELFNSRVGKHNFNHLMFFQTGYDLFVLRQAERRAWRIGQELDCTVDYFYYLGTMQATAMHLISRKMMAAMQLEEGKISEEGLAAMAGGGDQAALINAISNVIDPNDIERNWGKSRGGTGKRLKKVISVTADEPADEIEGIDFVEIPEPKAKADLEPVTDFGDLEDDEESISDEFDFENEELCVVTANGVELNEEDMDFGEEDLAAMFKGLGDTEEGDELDW